jgi:hypothetical protein
MGGHNPDYQKTLKINESIRGIDWNNALENSPNLRLYVIEKFFIYQV